MNDDRNGKNVYERHLKRLGFFLIGLYLIQLAGTLLFWSRITVRRPELSLENMIGECALALLCGGMALLTVKYARVSRVLLFFSAADFLALAYLLTAGPTRNIDRLIDLSLFLVGLVLYLELLSDLQQRSWQRTLKAKPIVLDVKIAGSGELFDPLVVAPHLEINQNIINAIDRFLDTARGAAPLQLYIHGGERISPPLRDTMGEVLRAHYEDEELRLNLFLERRFGRALTLLLVSIAALQILHRFSLHNSSAIVWTIVSNFAAFSLWQIGSTYFERAEAKRQLLRIRIAKNAEIRFL